MARSGRSVWLLLGLSLCALAVGCATPQNPDPFEKTNRFFYGFNESLDKHVMKPVADAYTRVTPQPVRTGLTNAFNNLGYLDTILNDLLQGEVTRGLADTGRMAANSTFGVAGIFDVATGMGLPKHKADFGQTLGKWGVKQGAYLVLPVLGPSTVREAPGIGVTMVTNPLFWVDEPAATIPVGVLGAVNYRAEASDLVRFRNEAAIEPYVFTREAYLKYRQNLVDEGKPATQPDLEDFDSAAPSTRPSTSR